MNKSVLEVTRKMIEIIKVQLTNKELYEYVCEKLKLVEELKKIEYQMSEEEISLSGIYDKKDELKITIKLNEGNISEIEVYCTYFNGRRTERKTITYSDNDIIVNEQEINTNIYEETNQLHSVQNIQKIKMYRDDQITYNYSFESTTGAGGSLNYNICYSKLEEMFVFSDRSAIMKTICVTDSNINISDMTYYKTNYCPLPDFSTRVKGGTSYICRMSYATKEEYEKELRERRVRSKIYDKIKML